MTKVATIAADVDGRRVLCRISGKDLQKKYQAAVEDPMRIVKAHHLELETVARLLIERENFEKDGSILMKYKDL